jgi:outer membrane receptor protein involved in Fe transport
VTESVAYTYQRARGSGAASSEFVELRLTPRHLANWRLDWRLPRGFTLSNAVRYVHSRHQSDGRTGLKLPSYTIWNVRLTKQILGAELYAAADNVTDKRYAEAFGVHPVSGSATLLPLPGRSYWGGLQIRFLD